MFDKYDLFFVYAFVLPVILAFIFDWMSNYIKACFKRFNSRRAAKARLEAMKLRERIELTTYRFRDPHYYGD